MSTAPESDMVHGLTATDPLDGCILTAMGRSDLDEVSCGEALIYPFPWSRGNFADCLVAGYDAWVLRRQGVLLAYAVLMWIPDEVHLLNLSVMPQWQGRGIGRAFLGALCEDAQRRGARGMMLEVRPSNRVAAALYDSVGFRQIGLRKRYYPSWNQTREDARVLFKDFRG